MIGSVSINSNSNKYAKIDVNSLSQDYKKDIGTVFNIEQNLYKNKVDNTYQSFKKYTINKTKIMDSINTQIKRSTNHISETKNSKSKNIQSYNYDDYEDCTHEIDVEYESDESVGFCY